MPVPADPAKLPPLLQGFKANLIKHRHPRWVGMRVGFGGLTLWSFLMATAHGAGLMLVPDWLWSLALIVSGVAAFAA